MKKFIVVLVPLFGIVAAFGIIEILFRIAAPQKTSRWNDRPAIYYIAERSPSFQDYPYEVKKPHGVFRIAVIGDSFTFAPYMQFDDTFPKRLERWLNLNAGQQKVEVINYGVPAYSTNHEVPVVRRAVEEGANLIVMQITLNDPELKPYTPTQLMRDRNKFGELELTHPIFRYWSSLGWVLKRLHNNQTHKNYVDKFFGFFEKKRTWNNFEGSWKTIAAIGEDKKVPVVAVVFPLFGIKVDAKYPFYPIHEKIGRLMDSLGIPFLDLCKNYEGLPLERLQVMPGEDFHPNEIGHRIAAEAILKWFGERNIVPSAIIPRVSSPERIGIHRPGTSATPAPADDSASEED